MEKTQAQEIEESLARQDRFFRDNPPTPAGPDVDDILDLLHTNPWD